MLYCVVVVVIVVVTGEKIVVNLLEISFRAFHHDRSPIFHEALDDFLLPMLMKIDLAMLCSGVSGIFFFFPRTLPSKEIYKEENIQDFSILVVPEKFNL